MATNYDIAFLRLLVERGAANRTQAMECLQHIDGELNQGRTVNAAQVVVQRGVLDRAQAERVHAYVAQQLTQSGQGLVAVDRERAIQEVSGEATALPDQQPAQPAVRYFDLGQSGEGLSDYQLGPLIAHGVSGSSYLGRRSSDGAPVVVKTLSRRFQDHPAVLEQVTNELRSWVGFSHPNAAATLAIGASHGHTAAVFEHAGGQTLEAYLAEHGPIPVDQTLDIVQALGEVVTAAHAKGLYVGDLRPRKLYYDGERVRLTDLGLSRASCLAAGFGQYGLPFGHPGYLAPEVLQEEVPRVSALADIYALGILFYELLCGRPPFQGDPAEVLEEHLDAPLPPPPEGVTFSTAVAGVILRMTAKTPSMRLQHAGLVMRAAKRLREGKPFRLLSGAESGSRVQQAVSRHDWDAASERAAEQEDGRWTATRIERAPEVGPSDLAPAPGLPVGEVSARLPRELIAQIHAEAEAEIAEVQSAVETAAPDEPAIKVGEKLGRGAVGTTYLGTVRGMDGPQVVKVVSRKYAKHADLHKRIMGSLKAATGLRHPNVVSILQVATVSGRDLVVSEQVAGETLRELLNREGPRPLREALGYVSDVASALDAAEDRGIAHGDIRPEKVYVDDGGIARLADFGHAEAACLGAGYGKAGLPFGHPEYLAPEVVQERGSEPNRHTDIYALGILFYELLCGRPPFQAKMAKEVLLAHLKKPLPPPPPEVSLPQPMADALFKMTAKDPKKRFDTAAELRDELQKAADPGQSGSVASAASFMVEEFNPEVSGEVTPQMWGLQSQVVAQPDEVWSKSKIKKAQKVGPMSWKPDAARRTAGEGLYADLERASDADGQAYRPKKKKKKGKKKKDQVDTKQLAIAGGSLLGVLILLVAFALSGGDDEGGGGNGPVAGDTPRTPPSATPKPTPDPEREKTIVRAVAELKERVERKIRDQDYPGGLEAVKGVDDSLRGDPRIEAVIREQEQAVQGAARQRLAQETSQVENLIAVGQLEMAAEQVKRMEAWALNKTQLEGLAGRIERAQAMRDKDVSGLKHPGKFQEAVVRRQLGQLLRGWSSGGRLFQKGGVILTYSTATQLKDDLVLLRGDPPEMGRAPVGGGGTALHINAAPGKPVLLALKLPLLNVVEASIEFVSANPPAPGSHFALVAGVRQRRRKGMGVSWGLLPAELTPTGVRALSADALPELEPRKALCMLFKTAGSSRRRVNLRPQLIDRASREKRTSERDTPVALKALQGMVAIYVEGAEVWISGMEVRGLVDAEALPK